MNEEQLADLLSEHLDALLSGETPATAPPAEVAQLLDVTSPFIQATPTPRPEFGPALRARLLPANGSKPSAGSALSSSTITLVVVVGLVILIGVVGLVIGLNLLGRTRSTTEPTPPPTFSLPTTPLMATATSPATPVPSATTSTPANTATVAPTATATLILDVLPPFTITLELEDELPSPPNLVPGSSGGGEDDHNGGGKNDGDHNKGHGNDEDHNDEDNPGGGHKK